MTGFYIRNYSIFYMMKLSTAASKVSKMALVKIYHSIQNAQTGIKLMLLYASTISNKSSVLEQDPWSLSPTERIA